MPSSTQRSPSVPSARPAQKKRGPEARVDLSARQAPRKPEAQSAKAKPKPGGRVRQREPQKASAQMQLSVGPAGVTLPPAISSLGAPAPLLTPLWNSFESGAHFVRSLVEKEPNPSAQGDPPPPSANTESIDQSRSLDETSFEEKWKRLPEKLTLWISPKKRSTFNVRELVKLSEPEDINGWFLVSPSSIWHGSGWKDFESLSDSDLRALSGGDEVAPPANIHGSKREASYAQYVMDFGSLVDLKQEKLSQQIYERALSDAKRLDQGEVPPSTLKSVFENLADLYSLTPQEPRDVQGELLAKIHYQESLNETLKKMAMNVPGGPALKSALKTHRDQIEGAMGMLKQFEEKKKRFGWNRRPWHQAFAKLAQAEKTLRTSLMKIARDVDLWPIFPGGSSAQPDRILAFMSARLKHLEFLQSQPVTRPMLIGYQQMLREAEDSIQGYRNTFQADEADKFQHNLTVVWHSAEINLRRRMRPEDFARLSSHRVVYSKLPTPDADGILRFMKQEHQGLLVGSPKLAEGYEPLLKRVESLYQGLQSEKDMLARKALIYDMHDTMLLADSSVRKSLGHEKWREVRQNHTPPMVAVNSLELLELMRLRYQSLKELNRASVSPMMVFEYQARLSEAQKLLKSAPVNVEALRDLFEAAELSLMYGGLLNYLQLNGPPSGA